MIPQGRAYLSIPEALLSTSKGFRLVFENGITTGIAGTTVSSQEEANKDGEWYTLQGIKLPNAPPTWWRVSSCWMKSSATIKEE